MASQLTVADFTSIRTPNSVGVLPENSIDSQPPYVWWITSGSFGAGSTLKDNKGGIYLIDMSQSLWSKKLFLSPNTKLQLANIFKGF